MASASTSYLQHWGLTAPAFVNPDSPLEPTTSRRHQTVVELRELLTLRCGVILVSGAKGVGKSALLKHLAAESPNSIYSVYSSGSPGWLKKRIDQHFCGAKGDANQSLAEILGLLYDKTVQMTCFIDVVQTDGHLWPAIDELLAASYLPNHTFNFVVAASPTDAKNATLEPTKRIQLEPFSKDECHDVIARLASKLKPNAMTSKLIDDLYALSQGIPGRLLPYAENLLIEAFAAEGHTLAVHASEQRKLADEAKQTKPSEQSPKRQPPRIASLSSLVVKRPDKL